MAGLKSQNNPILGRVIKIILLAAVMYACSLTDTYGGELKNYFSNHYSVRNVTMRGGLPHNFIDDIYKDKNGFLWLSFAGGGLARFDGKNVVTFTPNSKERPLKHLYVVNVVEDSHGRLWVASEGGLDVIDMRKLRTINDYKGLGLPRSIENTPIRNVYEDSKSRMWIQSLHNIYRICFDKKGMVETVDSMRLPAATYEVLPIRDIHKDGNPVCGMKGDLVRLKVHKPGQLEVRPFDNRLSIDGNANINDILGDDNCLWIATTHGLYRFSSKSGITLHYQHNPLDERTLSQNFLTSLALTPDSLLMVGTLRGLNLYDPAADRFERIPGSVISEESTACLINCMRTEDGMLFVGTEGSGMSIFSPHPLDYVHYGRETGYGGLDASPVNSIYESTCGDLWIGAVGGGLFRRRNGATAFEKVMTGIESIEHTSISFLTEDEKGNLWIGTWGDGIYVVDSSRPESVRTHIKQSDNIYPLEYIGVLQPDIINKGMWIGTNRGIWFYDHATGTPREVFDGSGLITNGSIGTLIDRKKRLWIGGTDGVFVFDLRRRDGNGHFSYHKLLGASESDPLVNGVHASSFHEDASGNMWIGTAGNGIFRIPADGKGDSYDKFTVYDGLPSDVVLGIEGDSDGNLWVATYDGLAHITNDGKSIKTFYLRDADNANQFFWNASLRSSSDAVYFGNGAGMIEIKGINNIGKNTIKPRFTALWIGSVPISADGEHGEEDISSGSEIIFHESDRSFTVQFSSMNYALPDEGTFQYKLEGFDKNWQTLPKNLSTVTYANLPSGHYKLLLRHSSDNNFDGSEPVAELPVTIIPYFYKRTWFILLVLLILLAIIYWIYVARTKSLIQQKEDLEKAVEESTREIQRQKALVEQQAHHLSQRNEVLMKANQELYEQKGRLYKMARDVEDNSSKLPGDEDENTKFFKRVMEVIREHYKDPNFDVGDFAEAVGGSRSLLNKKLNAAVGQSASQLVRIYRLSTARELIKKASTTKSMNIAEIAYEVGFNDSKYFTRCFTQHYSVSPSKMMMSDRQEASANLRSAENAGLKEADNGEQTPMETISENPTEPVVPEG